MSTGKTIALLQSSSPQWNAIEGKPFHADGSVSLFPPISYDATEGENYFPIFTYFQFTPGTEYVVTINNISFSCICQDMSEGAAKMYAIGNLSALGGEPTGNLPFLIVNIPFGEDAGDGTIAYGMFVHCPVVSGFSKGTLSVGGPDQAGVMLNTSSLPAMTATTKGGAIAGEGLVMDGDVLKVDMDLIIAQVKAALNG
ncbi:MAG: hypothetical protein IKK75_00790 [Clostridia bacterium]|nr:hypothetical protein [Clostridia bacterium]